MRRWSEVLVLVLLVILAVGALALMSARTRVPEQILSANPWETEDAAIVATMNAGVTPITPPALTATPEAYPGYSTPEQFRTPEPNMTAVSQTDEERAISWLESVRTDWEGTWSLVDFAPVMPNDDVERRFGLSSAQVTAGSVPDLAVILEGPTAGEYNLWVLDPVYQGPMVYFHNSDLSILQAILSQP